MAAACPLHGETIASRVEHITIEGSLECVHGDLFRVHADGVEQRFFATLLHPGVVHEILEELDCDPQVGAMVSASLRPDPAIGATVVGITVDCPSLTPQLDEIAHAAYAACLVQEALTGVHERESASQYPTTAGEME